MKLQDNLGPNGDALYAQLMEIHDGLSLEQSHALNARLVLILMNEIGAKEKVTALFKEARKISLG